MNSIEPKIIPCPTVPAIKNSAEQAFWDFHETSENFYFNTDTTQEKISAEVLQPTHNRIQEDHSKTEAVEVALVKSGYIASEALIRALTDKKQHNETSLDRVFLSQTRSKNSKPLFEALAAYWALEVVNLDNTPVDPELINYIGPEFCLRHGVLPIRSTENTTLVAITHPETINSLRKDLEARLGKIKFGLISCEGIIKTVTQLFGQSMIKKAEARVPSAESCRDLLGRKFVLGCSLVFGIMLFLIIKDPQATLKWVIIWAITTLILGNGLKIAAGIAASIKPKQKKISQKTKCAEIISVEKENEPIVSIIVALYQESNVAQRLIRRLSKIEYPSDRLDIVLVIEKNDIKTQNALENTQLPSWMRILITPAGSITTKPRALNFALECCRGSIVGVYDAEDAPEPKQLRKVVDHFRQSKPEVVCLQGILDFYNPTTNWLSRCFTIEYAIWFRLILPGLQRLGILLPLGGTTLFFRREALEKLGAWDAHNVTEDADLGVRLARHGMCTEMVETVTAEEANCRILPWVKQRSRWIKGYMVTWIVHMRNPFLLWKQLGTKGFIGFQILFLCTLSQFLLAPVLWSFWLVLFGIPHPVIDALPKELAVLIMALFISTEALNVTIGILAFRKTKHRFSRWWIPTLQVYFPLASLASYKAAWEVLRKPFYWDKTAHGAFTSDNILEND